MAFDSRSLVFLLVRCAAVAGTASMVATQPVSFTGTEQVTVKWSGISTTTDPTTDWVSVWWEPFKATYVEFVNVTGSDSSGSASFSLLNARHGYVFRYYREDTMLAESNAVYPEGAFPMQVRLSLVANQADSMRIAWTSNRTTAQTVLRYGTDPSNLSLEATATASTYTHDELQKRVFPDGPPIPTMTQPFSNIGSRSLRCGHGCYQDNTTCLLYVDPGTFHSVVLTGLQPNTKYYYQVGEKDQPDLMSEVFFFTSRPSLGKAAKADQGVAPDPLLSILYFADGGVGGNGDHSGGFAGGAMNNDPPQNGGDTVWAAVERDQQTNVDDLLLFNGDISYARGWPFTWEVFHNMTQAFTSHIPAVYSYGNHEFDFARNPWSMGRGHDSGGEAGIVAARRFNMIEEVQNDTNPVSLFLFGPVAVITLSSEHDPSAQAPFLQKAIQSLDRSPAGTPWLLVQLHRPLYASGGVDSTSKAYRKAWAPILEDPSNDVTMVLTGHQHYYERMCAVRGGMCAAQAPIYVIDGSAGAEFSPLFTPSYKLTEYKDFSKWGYSRMLVNTTYLKWSHMHTDRPGVPVDTVTLTK